MAERGIGDEAGRGGAGHGKVTTGAGGVGVRAAGGGAGGASDREGKIERSVFGQVGGMGEGRARGRRAVGRGRDECGTCPKISAPRLSHPTTRANPWRMYESLMGLSPGQRSSHLLTIASTGSSSRIVGG